MIYCPLHIIVLIMNIVMADTIDRRMHIFWLGTLGTSKKTFKDGQTVLVLQSLLILSSMQVHRNCLMSLTC